jgi:transcriptional regulator with XRE-family HTH domain
VLSNNLKKLREVKKLTQKNLSEMLGVGISTVSGWESGYRHPDVEILVKIADLFDVSVDSLLGRTDFSVKVDIESERIKYLSDVEKLRDEVLQTFNKALTDGLLTEEQARMGLTLIQKSLELVMASNKGKPIN